MPGKAIRQVRCNDDRRPLDRLRDHLKQKFRYAFRAFQDRSQPGRSGSPSGLSFLPGGQPRRHLEVSKSATSHCASAVRPVHPSDWAGVRELDAQWPTAIAKFARQLKGRYSNVPREDCCRDAIAKSFPSSAGAFMCSDAARLEMLDTGLRRRCTSTGSFGT
jgi:hypothetical protein